MNSYQWLLGRGAQISFLTDMVTTRAMLQVGPVSFVLPIPYDWDYATFESQFILPAFEIVYRYLEYANRALCWHCGSPVRLFLTDGWQCTSCFEGSPSTLIASNPVDGCLKQAPYVLETNSELD
jgi:hypothetical protein